MSQALKGYRILDFTHVQSGPTCTQLLAWFGADVIKVERAGEGDATRDQLRDIPGVDSLYFTMLNHNKRSITIDTKKPKGKAVLETLIKQCDVLVENFAPGALDRMGFSWERIHELNPRWWSPRSRVSAPASTRTARSTRTSRSALAVRRRRPAPKTARRWSPARRSATAAPGCTSRSASSPRCCSARQSGRGQKVLAPMQDAVLNLCRVKLRDQQRLDRTGTMHEYPQYPDGKFGDAVPRAGNASGGGQPGSILRCKGWETDPNAYIYFITQAAVWPAICKVIGEEGWIDDEAYATPAARLLHLKPIFKRIEKWTMTKDKIEAMDILNKLDIPCGPILSMKEIAEDEWLRKSGTIVEVDHPTRGKYLTVGNPIKLSDSPTDRDPFAAARRTHRRGADAAGLRCGRHRGIARGTGHMTAARARR